MAQTPEEMAMDWLTGKVRAMPQFAVDPQIEDSLFYKSDPYAEFGPMAGGIEPTLPLLADVTPLGDADAMIQGAADRDPLALALAALSLGVPGTIKIPKEAKQALDMSTEARMARAAKQGYLPETFYHGTTADIAAFEQGGPQVGGAIHFSSSPLDANAYAGEVRGANVLPVKLRVAKTFDYESPDDLAALADHLGLERGNELLYGEADPAGALWGAVAKGDYDALEAAQMQEFLRGNGYDSFTLNQYGGDKGIAVYDPSRIRSISAAFDPDKLASPDLLAGLALAYLGGKEYSRQPQKHHQ